MKITRIRTFPITLTVRPEFYIVSSAGTHAISRYVVVALETNEGVTGWGEATVVPLWSGESQGGAIALIEDYVVLLLKDRDFLTIDLEGIDFIVIDNDFTKAVVEMALLDLIGKQQQKPIYEILGGVKNLL